MFEELITKLVTMLTEPVQLVLLAWVIYLITENWKVKEINSKLLKAQEERGVVLGKITVMLEALFNDSRRAK